MQNFILYWFFINLNYFIGSIYTKELIKSQDIQTQISTIIPLPRNPKSIDSREKSLDSIFKNFQINKNSIIKTHDSRSLGAKYLNETELSSNEDCILWCWNTSNCNLAVFEEKTRGSCYLFDCGSTQDFKCRFASHTFYTSSILQINRNSYLLNEWKSQTNQENELVVLKEKPYKLDGHSVDNKEIQPQSKNKFEATTLKVSKCLHYQFECRNNSECIAIYNVCDGISQCPDGSDEALELECHKSRLNVNVNNNKNYIDNEIGRASDMNSIEKNLKMQSNRISGNYYPYNYKDIQHKYSSNNLNNYNYAKSPNEKMLEENSFRNRIQMNNGGDYNGFVFSNNWNQYQMPVEKPIEKMGLLTNAEPDQYKESIYWPSFKYNVENFVPHSSSLTNQDVPYNVPMSMNDIRSKMDYFSQQQQQYNRMSPPTMNPLVGEMKTHSDNRISNLTNGLQLNESQETKNKTATKMTSKINYSHISSNEGMSVKTPNIVAISYMHDTGIQNGRETNSAVIALTLGLFITCILIVIVGCRMKSFKKRIARRGRSLVHDADYLINGMYL